MMRRPLVCLSAVGVLAVQAAAAQAETVSVTFLVVNDTDTIETDDRGGFARIAATIAAERSARENVVVVHAGDSISPSLLSSIDQGAHIVDLLNQTGIDAFVPGNHEFDFGPEVFRTRMGELTVPKLLANVSEADGSALAGFSAEMTKTFGPVTIGLVGLTSDDATEKSSPGDLQFADMMTTLSETSEAMEADYVVAVAHASRSEDMALMGSGLADMVLSGDDHDLTVLYDGRTILAEGREQGEFIPAIDVTFTVEGEGEEREVDADASFRIIDTAGVTPDEEVQAAIDRYNAELDEELNVAIGTSTTALDTRRASVRGGETAIGNLIADAMREAAGTDVAITNGGGIRGDKEYDAGTELTRRDVLTELPFGNKTVSFEMTGAQIIALLENGFSAVEDGGGRFPHLSGMSVEVDLTAEPGSRVSAATVNGAPLDEGATYTVATNDFMGRGGDGFDAFTEATPVIEADDGDLMANDVISFIEGRGEISPGVEGRITVN